MMVMVVVMMMMMEDRVLGDKRAKAKKETALSAHNCWAIERKPTEPLLTND